MYLYVKKKSRVYTKFLVRKKNRNSYISESLLRCHVTVMLLLCYCRRTLSIVINYKEVLDNMNKTLVAQLRKERNWTQEELAERSYVTVRTIQRLESGDDVSHDTLRAVANALSVSVNNLFESIDDEESEIEINQLSKRQSFQMKKRTEEYHIYKIMIVAFIFIIMSLLGVFIPNIDGMLQTLLGIFWIFLLFTSIAFYRYFIYIYLSKKKYLVTII